MKRERKEYREPYGRGHYELVRGEQGVYWQACSGGLLVRVAAAEQPGESNSEFSLGGVVPLEEWSVEPAR